MRRRGHALRRRYGHTEGPGKFEGESPWVRAIFEEGFSDEEASYPDGGGWFGLWHISAEDRAKWPELEDVVGVILHERSDGFVDSSTFKSDAALKKAWARIEEDTSAGDEEY